MQKWVSVLWPSFIMSAVATAVVFLFLNPVNLAEGGGPALTSLGYYSVTFLFLWATMAATTLISFFFQRPPESINRTDRDRLPGVLRDTGRTPD